MDMDLVGFVVKVIAKDAVVQMGYSYELCKIECFFADDPLRKSYREGPSWQLVRVKEYQGSMQHS